MISLLLSYFTRNNQKLLNYRSTCDTNPHYAEQQFLKKGFKACLFDAGVFVFGGMLYNFLGCHPLFLVALN
jgi:hypothetical protein